MITSPTPGQQIAMRFEGCVLSVYDDGWGNLTAGWGHRVPRTWELGTPIGQAQADQWFGLDWETAGEVVDANVTAPLSANQRDALIDFVFNVGPGVPRVKDGFVFLKSGAPSTLLRLVNASDFRGALKEFHKWNHVKGQVVQGLVKRRLAEALLFSTEDF